MGFGSYSARVLLPCGMWDLPRPAIKLVSPALAGRSWTTREVSTRAFSPFCPLISCRCLPLAGTQEKAEDAGVCTLHLSRAVSHGTGGRGQTWRGEQPTTSMPPYPRWPSPLLSHHPHPLILHASLFHNLTTVSI